MLDAKRRKEIEHRIGYTFHNPALLEKALTHSSYSNEHRLGKLNNNERLEFLGDAVLEVVSSEFLYKKYPKRAGQCDLGCHGGDDRGDLSGWWFC